MKLRQYHQVAQRLLKANLNRQLAYPNSFIFAIVGKLGRMSVLVIFFESIFRYTRNIGSWQREDVLVLLAVYLTFETIIVITFHRNLLYYLPEHIRKGTFDSFLVQPLPLLPHVAFRIIDFMDLLSAIFVVGLWSYLGTLGILVFSAATLMMFLIACLIAVLFTFGLSTLFAALSFWSLTGTGAGRLFEQFFRIGRYPTDTLGGVGMVLTYVIPFALVGTIPAAILRNLAATHLLVGAGISGIAIWLIGQIAWRSAVRRYSSASS